MNLSKENLQNLLIERELDKVLKHLQNVNEISFEEQEVIYNFFVNLKFQDLQADTSFRRNARLLGQVFYQYEKLDEKFIEGTLFSSDFDSNPFSTGLQTLAITRSKTSLELEKKIFELIYVKKQFLPLAFENNDFLHSETIDMMCDYYLKEEEEPYGLAFHSNLNINHVFKLIQAGLPQHIFQVIKISGKRCVDASLPYCFLIRNNPSFIAETLKENNVDEETFKIFSEDSDLSLTELMFLTNTLSEDSKE